MYWAGDLARMYERYGQKIGWSVKPVSASESDMGGFKELVISVKGDSVYSQLKFEAGVHRVKEFQLLNLKVEFIPLLLQLPSCLRLILLRLRLIQLI